MSTHGQGTGSASFSRARPAGWLFPLLVASVNAVFDTAVRITHADVLRRRVDSPGARRDAMASRTDTIAAASLVLAVLAFLAIPMVGPVARWLIWGFAGARVFLLVTTMLRVSLTWRYARSHGEWFDESVHRVVMLALLSYVETIMLFATVYAGFPHLIQGAAEDATLAARWLDAFHLSTMTQMTVGYGDLRPLGGLRLVASGQVMVALLLLSLILAQFVSRLHEDKMEDDGA